MFFDPFSVAREYFNNKWGTTNKDMALTLSSVDDAMLKDCIVTASTLVWGVLMMRPAQLEACYHLLHPH
jgi:hypothetical protein